MNTTTTQYRPEIDGLRAIAVLPVILFHAGLSWLPGGFVGVDVFFVISGFLITGILAREMSEGSYSLLGFYERRARRILPALMLVLVVTTILAAIFMLPYELRNYGRALVAVIGFVANILFWQEAGYFAEAAELKPLLHTWSLAVEEQFYIIFPVALYLLWRFPQRVVVSVLALVALGSLALAEYLSLAAPRANFFLLPSRAWELLAGSLAALYLMRRPQPGGMIAELAGVIGLAAILGAMFVVDGRTPFPSAWALLPVLGTVAILIAARPETIAGRILTIRPFVWVGLISYSAYLWHQPLFAFARLLTIEGHPSETVMGGLAMLSLGLAWISWRFVEQPFRRRDRFGRTAIFSGSAIGGVMFVGIGAVLFLTHGYPGRFSDEKRAWVETRPLVYGNYVRGAYRKHALNAPLSDTKPNLVLVGDSFSQDFYNIIAENGAFSGHAISAIAVPAPCQIHYGIPNGEISGYLERSLSQCLPDFLSDDDVAKIRKADVVIFVASWRAWSAERLARSIENMDLGTEKEIYVIGSKSFEKSRRYFLHLDDPRLAFKAPGQTVLDTNAAFDRSFSPEIFVKTTDLLCPDLCPLLTPEGALISHDGKHLTREGALYVGQLLFAADPLRKYARAEVAEGSPD